MERFKQNNSQNVDEGSFSNNWNGIKNYLERKTSDSRQIIFFSTTPHAGFLFEQFQTNQNQSTAAHNYLVGQDQNLNNISSFIGYLQAYEFVYQDESKIVKRRKQERAVLRDIRNEAEQKTNDITKEYEELKITLSEWKNKFIEEHEKWQILRKENLTEFIEDKSKVLQDLETIYKDKLSLEAPVQYWKDRVKKYRFQGIVWLTFLTLVVFLIA